VAPPYREREARFAQLARAKAVVSRRYSRARLLIALLTAIAALAWLTAPEQAWELPALLAGIAAFLVLVVRHDRIEQEREAQAALAAINRDAQHRLERDWSKLLPAWHVEPLDDHPYASDLDLFGHASVVQILGPVQTPTGRMIVSRWLLQEPQTADPATIARRQTAVRELAPQLDFRQQLTVAARRIPALDSIPAPLLSAAESDATLVRGFLDEARRQREPSLVRFLDWAEEPSWLLSRPWIPWIASTLGVGTTSLFVAWLAGVVASPWWAAGVLAGWILRFLVRHPLEHAFAGAAGEYGLRSWTALIGLIERASWTSAELSDARAALASGGRAGRALRSLEQLVALADFRLSTWLYLPVQSLTLCELHVWWAIERWRAAHGHHVADWLAAIGKVEAISSLASLAFDHPEWAFPEVSTAHDRLESSAVGHPLLADDVRVANDLTVGPPGRFVLITGSNMSGKSTLLRSMGVNVVLAQAGAPVCASRLSMPPLALHTSMRVADSLERGLSLFMASLVRLERIVRAAREARDRTVCYLLDEVLQGTNSAERQVAVRTIISHLLATRAIGVVTTHDLELAHDPAFTAHADSYHLQETLAGESGNVVMTFDYKLRPGPAEAGNALQLLRMLGLGDR
jgi:hypothetical protein